VTTVAKKLTIKTPNLDLIKLLK